MLNSDLWHQTVSGTRHSHILVPKEENIVPPLIAHGCQTTNKFGKGNASFAHGNQNSTLSYDMNNNTLSFL